MVIKVLFVCMGNICRSPTAEGVFRKLVQERGLSEQIQIDSAGTHGYHIGEPPDKRSQAAAKKRGVEISQLRARQATMRDFDEFDYIIAMDKGNYQLLVHLATVKTIDKLSLFLDFAPQQTLREVPDPYYGNEADFERVLDLTEIASEGLLADIQKRFLQ